MLTVTQLCAGYGPLEVLHGVSFEVPAGAIVAILGANGAGKTTLMRALMGLIRPRGGSIIFDGQHLEHASTEQRVRSGLALVPEGRELFGSLTVKENLLMGAFTRHSAREIEDRLAHVLDYFPRLKTMLQVPAASLSGGEGQMLAIGRALMSRPRLLLLDEPSQGLAPVIVETVLNVIVRLNRDDHLTVVLSEQNARKALQIAGQAYVLQSGIIALQGQAQELAQTSSVQELYLFQSQAG